MENTQTQKVQKQYNPQEDLTKTVVKSLGQLRAQQAVEAAQSGVPDSEILGQLMSLSQTQVPQANTIQGPFAALGGLLQGKPVNPMAPRTSPIGLDMAIKLQGAMESGQKTPLEIEKLQQEVKQAPLQTKKLEKEVEQMDPRFQKQPILSATDVFSKYQQAVQPFVVQRDAYSRIKASGQDPSPAGDLAIIYGYMKMLDPGSTVREGEFATAGQAGSIPTRILGLYNKVVSGKRLADEQRTDFLNRSERIFKSADSQYRATRKAYTKLAVANKLDPEATIQDVSLTDESYIPTRSEAPEGATGWDTEKNEWVY